MSDRFRTGKPPRRRTSHTGQLSLDLPFVGSYNEYQRKLGSKQHIEYNTLARICGMALLAVSA